MLEVRAPAAGYAPELGERLAVLRQLLDAGDFTGARSLLERDLVAVWIGHTPAEITAMLDRIRGAGVDLGHTLTSLGTFFTTDSADRLAASAASAAPESTRYTPGNLRGSLSLIARIVDLRRVGRAHEALRLIERFDVTHTHLQVDYDVRGGWDLALANQAGLTALIAGRPQLALMYLTVAQVHPVEPSLVSLSRFAHVLAALTHALFSDANEARVTLGHAAALPRSAARAETQIDTLHTIAEALLEPEADRVLTLMRGVPLAHIGELWPVYVLALNRACNRGRHLSEMDRRLARLETLNFPRVAGRGLAGSVFPAVRAVLCFRTRDFDGVIGNLDRCDQDQPMVLLLRAMTESTRGDPRTAIALAHRAEPLVRNLRQYELWRFAVLTGAFLALDDLDRAREAAQAAFDLSREIRPQDVSFFQGPALQFAAETIPGWPEFTAEAALDAEFDGDAAQLTEREHEILRLLARARPRAEIAAQLFVSRNTLKTHLRAIYRKLEVSSRADAVARAQRLGWI